MQGKEDGMKYEDAGIARFTEHQTLQRDAWVVFEDDPVPLLTDTGKSEWMPRKIRVVWQREKVRGYPWGEWITAGATVTGPRLKLDGTEHAGMEYQVRNVREDDENFGTWVRSTRPNADIP